MELPDGRGSSATPWGRVKDMSPQLVNQLSRVHFALFFHVLCTFFENVGGILPPKKRGVPKVPSHSTCEFPECLGMVTLPMRVHPLSSPRGGWPLHPLVAQNQGIFDLG